MTGGRSLHKTQRSSSTTPNLLSPHLHKALGSTAMTNCFQPFTPCNLIHRPDIFKYVYFSFGTKGLDSLKANPKCALVANLLAASAQKFVRQRTFFREVILGNSESQRASFIATGSLPSLCTVGSKQQQCRPGDQSIPSSFLLEYSLLNGHIPRCF